LSPIPNILFIGKSPYPEMLKKRYSSFDSGNGAAFEKGKLDLEALVNLAKEIGEPEQRSGKQELYENIINEYI